jgi:hypothetical protein
MFQSYGLSMAPGMTSYLQTASVTKTTPAATQPSPSAA